MRELFDLISRVAPADSTVLITGETGSGKELVARAIHRSSNRSGSPFVAVNCAAIPENLFETELFGHEKGSFTGAMERRIGRFEYADGGTIFLDEIGCLSAPMQAKLLRVLQEDEIVRVGGTEPVKIDARVICATNADLAGSVKKKLFRDDLFYRLNVIPVPVPALRQRGEDIILIFHHFLERFNKKFGKRIRSVSNDLINAISTYPWPGNVRELENVAERMVALAQMDSLDLRDLPSEIKSKEEIKVPLNDILDGYEAEYIIKALSITDGNQSKAADLLRIDRSTLISKMKKHSISSRDNKQLNF